MGSVSYSLTTVPRLLFRPMHPVHGFLNGRWFRPREWLPQAIMAKELVPIVISCAIWGPILSRKSVLFKCDNTGVVAAIKKGSAREPLVMHLLRTLWFFVAHFDICINIEHIPGVRNEVADMLSRDNMQQFFTLNPQADLIPTGIPMELLQIMSVATPDWTSARFEQLFSATISKV